MGQIITSFFNFLLEVGRSGDRYKTRRNKSKAITIILWATIVLAGYTAFTSFGEAYVSKAQVIRLKDKIARLEKLREENAELKIRNEILSATLSHYIGQPLVDRINNEKNSGLKDKLSQVQVEKEIITEAEKK